MKALSLSLCVLVMLWMMVSCSQILYESESLNNNESVTDKVTNADISKEEIELLMDLYMSYEYYTKYESLEIDKSIKDDSGLYFKVINEKYDTWDEWIAFYESIYAGAALNEELNTLDNSNRVINIDGYTYCAPGSMGWPLSNEYSYEIIKSNPERALVSIYREQRTPGQKDVTEREWFYLLGLTNAGWRILNIIPFK